MNIHILALLLYAQAEYVACLNIWSRGYLMSMISIRILKRSWKPLGPSANTEEVLPEYKWDVTTAFKSLLKSSYEYESAKLENVDKLFRSGGEYNSSLPSIVILHPIFATADVFFVKTTMTAFAMRNLHKSHNIFAVDMPYLNLQMILTVARNTFGMQTQYEPIAESVSMFLVKAINSGVMSPSQIHLIGWSYSGHLVGYMARFIFLLYHQKIASIVSLDPYTNYVNQDLVHVAADDADVVHVYHSNSLVAGTRERIGTADFVFNDGVTQPECKGLRVLKNTIPEPMVCSHLKVVQRFWYVILYPSLFVARRCDTWKRFNLCLCEENKTTTFSIPIDPKQKVTGTYYLRTIETKPYGVGAWGSTCSSTSMLQLKNHQSTARRRAKVPPHLYS